MRLSVKMLNILHLRIFVPKLDRVRKKSELEYENTLAQKFEKMKNRIDMTLIFLRIKKYSKIYNKIITGNQSFGKENI